MPKREAIIPAGMEAVYEKIGYAPAIKVGDTVYVSGQIGRDAAMQRVEDREAQIVQAFEKVAFLNPAAPVVGPPFAAPQNTHFAIAQGVALLFFIVVGIVDVIRFRPAAPL